MSHRSKNQLTLLLSMLRHTSRHFGDIENFSLAFEERLRGLVHTQDLLVANDWRGVGLADMVNAQAHALRLPVPDKIAFNGPNILVKPEPAQNLSLALHELMRNATRHGALSSPNGRVKITWAFSDSTETASVMLLWIESGGPPIHQGDTTGFGLTILRRVLRPAIGGPVEIDFRSSGLRVGLSIAEACLSDR